MNISIDSRSIREREIFIAIKGHNFDGNDYVFEALEKGALRAISSRPSLITHPKFKEEYRNKIIFVENTLKTLQQMALDHRNSFKIPVIGITGTNGKTTTKELIGQVLEEKYYITKTEGNLNNEIGVPLTLLRINKYTKIAVIEMGANHHHDIKDLCKLVQPTHGLITNIGVAHLQGFGSKEGVMDAKRELYKSLIRTRGTIFINKHDKLLKKILNETEKELQDKTPVVSYGGETIPQNKNIFGDYNNENMQTAYAVGQFFGVPKHKIIHALQSYETRNGRSEIKKTKKENTVILDAYNANPSSMETVLKSFKNYPTKEQKWLILGDMKELGTDSEKEHKALIKLLISYKFSNVILVGPEFIKAHLNQKLHATFQTREECAESPLLKNIKNAHILIKGSNSMQLWKLADKL